MLTQDTKKHIDAARQILVGVVPNPMSQVEQITNALIYKFMDDMDQQAIKAGGDPSFFVKDLEKYAWTKVMDSRLGNQDRMNLYTEALMKFSEAKQLPQLFRDIFKQAFLPYRDPEVLGLFLKEISYFDYTHSEELGNAYEYLLSIMSSQGDAGQFRTPRHIIDFIVDVLAPTKDDTILDPACGTAGFLISAYNYIKRQNEGLDLETGKMRQLTADERRKLVNNFEGYDVDPTMVRMSQVNMYLHKFTTPKIYNYNTLASEDRWNDKFDLILANPPFMSPKGGIKPHNKFSVQANRAEVLFVDYITNHLKPKGRAGIIVPEGVIFQSGKAYKELRKNLVNDGLFSVVSLPAGVFNPYSGVKTSILFFDNEVAKKTKDLLFVKVMSDGYDLGAQRRKVEKDDLGDAGVILKGFRTYVRNGENQETIESFIAGSGKGSIVPKEKIAETGDYNLSADRYRITSDFTSTKYPMVRIDEVCEILSGGGFPLDEQGATNGDIPFLKISDMNLPGNEVQINHANNFVNKDTLKKLKVKIAPKGTIIFPKIGAAIATNKKRILSKESAYDNNVMGLIPNEKINPSFLFYLLKQLNLSDWASASALPSIRKSDVEKYLITLPPLEVQKEIVEQIEVKQKAIDGAKQVIENLERERRYFGKSLRKLDGVKMVELGEIADVTAGQSPEGKYYNESKDGTPFYQGKTEFRDTYLGNPKVWTTKVTKLAEEGDILISVRAPVGPVNITKEKICIGRGLASIRAKATEQMYLFHFLRSIQNEITGNGGAVFDSINKSQIEKINIPVVSKEAQKEIVEKINMEDKIIESNKKLIEIMEKKINEVLESV
jgi:type I restriction enzyme M protein